MKISLSVTETDNHNQFQEVQEFLPTYSILLYQQGNIKPFKQLKLNDKPIEKLLFKIHFFLPFYDYLTMTRKCHFYEKIILLKAT